MPLTCTGTERAGDGNRTRMTSLEGWGSTIELRPRNGDRTAGPAGPSGGSVPAPAPPGVTHAGPSAPPSGIGDFRMAGPVQRALFCTVMSLTSEPARTSTRPRGDSQVTVT